MSVTTPKNGNNPLFHAMVEAGVQAGFPRTEDLNGYQQEGFGPMDRTVTRKAVAPPPVAATWTRPAAGPT